MACNALQLIDRGVSDGELLLVERLRAKNAEVERDRVLELLAEARGYLSCADCGYPSCNQADLAERIDALVESVASEVAWTGPDVTAGRDG